MVPTIRMLITTKMDTIIKMAIISNRITITKNIIKMGTIIMIMAMKDKTKDIQVTWMNLNKIVHTTLNKKQHNQHTQKLELVAIL